MTRRAGTYDAISAAVARTKMALVNTSGSVGLTPKSITLRMRATPQATAIPIRRPTLASVLGYVADRKLGTVGSTTAGTNGNIATFPVPGGFTIAFTGMRVTGHDGRTPHHLVGITPDISIAPTLAALRDGRDEVLDRALALIRGK